MDRAPFLHSDLILILVMKEWHGTELVKQLSIRSSYALILKVDQDIKGNWLDLWGRLPVIQLSDATDLEQWYDDPALFSAYISKFLLHCWNWKFHVAEGSVSLIQLSCLPKFVRCFSFGACAWIGLQIVPGILALLSFFLQLSPLVMISILKVG